MLRRVQRLDAGAGAEVQGGGHRGADGEPGERGGRAPYPEDHSLVAAARAAGAADRAAEVGDDEPVLALRAAVRTHVNRGAHLVARPGEPAVLQGLVARQCRSGALVRDGLLEQEQPYERVERGAAAGGPQGGHGLAAGQRGVGGRAEQVEQAVGGEVGREQGVAEPGGAVGHGQAGGRTGGNTGRTHPAIVAAGTDKHPRPGTHMGPGRAKGGRARRRGPYGVGATPRSPRTRAWPSRTASPTPRACRTPKASPTPRASPLRGGARGGRLLGGVAAGGGRRRGGRGGGLLLAAGLLLHRLAEVAGLQLLEGVVAALADGVQLVGDALEAVGELRLVAGVERVDLLLEVAVRGGGRRQLLGSLLLGLVAVLDGRDTGLVEAVGKRLVRVRDLLEGSRVRLLDVNRLALVGRLLLDGGVGVSDLLDLRLGLVAEGLGPVLHLLVRVVAAATRQCEHQYRAAGQCGRKLLVHRIGPFQGSRPRNIHAKWATTACPTPDLLAFGAICTKGEKAHDHKATGGRCVNPHRPPVFVVLLLGNDRRVR